MSQVYSRNINSFNVSNRFNLRVTDEESEILALLSPLEPRIRHHDIRTQRVEGVGDWLLRTKEYRSWCSGSEQDESYRAGLFCYGHPGVGKSFLTSLVIDSLCDRARGQNIAVSCFYFDFASRKDHSPINMLGSLLKQLVSGLKTIPNEVVEEYREQKKVIGGRGLQVSGMAGLFQSVSSTQPTFICIDALDECVPVHRVEVLDILGHVLQKSPNTRVFMTGRSHIREEVERQLGGRVMSLLIKPTEHDIALYLEARLKQDTTPEVMNSRLKKDIMRSIPQAISETFLLVSLNIEAILQETTIGHRRRRLKAMRDGLGLEPGLQGAYGVTLERIEAQDKVKSELAKEALMWVCYSERPLKVDELCHALAAEIGSTDFDPDDVPLIGTLIGFCQGLITVDQEASTVRLIHHTLQEYLSSHLDLSSRAHSKIAEKCLRYLNSQRVKDLSYHRFTYLRNVPFLEYASLHWGVHAKRELTGHVKSLAMELLGQYENHVSGRLLVEIFVGPGNSGYTNRPSRFTGLHCASYFGIAEFVATLMERNGSDINKQDCLGATPLEWAATQGHKVVVKLLLEHRDIDPCMQNSLGQTALLRAAGSGYVGVVKLLLQRKEVNPDMRDQGGRTPLSFASASGYEGVVKLLLGREEVIPDIPDQEGATPLSWAASKGHEGVVELLLEREEVSPDMPDKVGRTPLSLAASRGHQRVVKLLLERQVNPNIQDHHGRTPLFWASSRGHQGAVKLLLDRKEVNPRMPDHEGRTPLLIAARKGHEIVVELLLERGEVKPDTPDKEGGTPLSWAASMGHAAVVELLIEQEEVNPDMPDQEGRTPLLIAAWKGHERVVKLLLERKEVNPGVPDQEGRTPLLIAAWGGHEGVVKLLLERKEVNPDMPDYNDRTPLSWAASMGHEGVVKLLLEREEVNPGMPDQEGTTPLWIAAWGGHEGVVKLLLERKEVNPDTPDQGGRTPLVIAARKGHERVVKLLL